MQIDVKLLKRLEQLSQIEIDRSKESEILEDLNKFLEFVDVLNELDVENIEATFSTLETGSPFRKDIPISQSEIGEKILKNAPKSADNFFIVPKIIE